MAIPGRVDSRASGGCNELIRAGARLVRNAADVEEELSELIPKTGTGGRGRSPSAPPPPFSIEESMIMREVDAEGVSMDVLIRRTGLPAEKVNALCMALRLKGRVRFFPGNRVALPREA